MVNGLSGSSACCSVIMTGSKHYHCSNTPPPSATDDLCVLLHPLQTAGCGKPVLLVHGFGASCGHYRKTIPFLAENGYKVCVVPCLTYTLKLDQLILRRPSTQLLCPTCPLQCCLNLQPGQAGLVSTLSRAALSKQQTASACTATTPSIHCTAHISFHPCCLIPPCPAGVCHRLDRVWGQ